MNYFMNQIKSYLITSEPFLNHYEQRYRNIVTINLPPKGPLAKYVLRIKMPRLSHFCADRDRPCALAITSFKTNINNSSLQFASFDSGKFSNILMTDNEIGDLFSFLLANGYNIDTNLTNMMNTGEVKLNNKKIICFITYNGV